MRRSATAAAILAAILTLTAAAHADEQTPAWKTLNDTWQGGNKASIWKIAAWPGKDLLVASVRSNGLWSSADGGEIWQRMGESGKTPPNAGQAVQFVFDPKDSNTMWTSGMYNYGVWKTADGGKTFTHIGNNNHVDGFAVDFTDPDRKIQLMGLHEQEHSLHKSTDGGATWVKIGDKIPAGSEFSTDPIILDAKKYIIDSNGWSKPGEHWGIYRTEDGGETWTNVSSEGAAGNATITSKGDIFWSVQWDQQIIKSSDHGKTWERIKAPARGIVIEIKPDRLVALGGKDKTQMYVSKDDGITWTPFGSALPFKTRGVVYDDVRKCLVAWEDRAQSGRKEGSLARFDFPADIEAAFAGK